MSGLLWVCTREIFDTWAKRAVREYWVSPPYESVASDSTGSPSAIRSSRRSFIHIRIGYAITAAVVTAIVAFEPAAAVVTARVASKLRAVAGVDSIRSRRAFSILPRPS